MAGSATGSGARRIFNDTARVEQAVAFLVLPDQLFQFLRHGQAVLALVFAQTDMQCHPERQAKRRAQLLIDAYHLRAVAVRQEGTLVCIGTVERADDAARAGANQLLRHRIRHMEMTTPQSIVGFFQS